VTRRIDPLVALAAARTAVGIGFIAAPQLALPKENHDNSTALFLMRTIGIRDLVLGAGGVWARLRGTQPEFRRWAAVGFASDVVDGAAAVASARLIGKGSAALAAGIVAPWVATGAVGLARRPNGGNAPD